VLLAEQSGIPRETAVHVLLNSVIASPMIKYRGPFVLGQPDEAWFDVNMMQKDLLVALEMGRQLNVPLPTTATANQMLTAARALGLEKRDFASALRGSRHHVRRGSVNTSAGSRLIRSVSPRRPVATAQRQSADCRAAPLFPPAPFRESSRHHPLVWHESAPECPARESRQATQQKDQWSQRKNRASNLLLGRFE